MTTGNGTQVRASTMATRREPEEIGEPLLDPPFELPHAAPQAAPVAPEPPRDGALVVLRLDVQGAPSDAELQLMGRFLLEAAQRGMSPVDYYNHITDMLDAYDKYVPEARQS